MRRAALVATAVAVAAASAGCGSTPRAAAPERATSVTAPDARLAGDAIPSDAPAADFALRDQDGNLIRLSAQHGHLVFVAFLYSHCQDVCPLLATWLDGAARALGPRARDVRVLAVSVDPAGDTQAAVKAFVRRRGLGSEFHWLIGTRAQLAPVWQSYNVLVESRSLERIAHSAPVFLLDRKGRPRVFYPPPQRQRAFVHDARLLLGA